MKNKAIFELTLLSALTAILIVQKLVLSFLPNIQLTVLLIMVYTRALGIKRSTFIVLVYTLVDSAIFGGISLYTIFLCLGWLSIVILMGLCVRKTENALWLALWSVLFSLLFCWIMIIPSVWLMKVKFWDYLWADMFFEVILAASSFLSVLWLFNPLAKFLTELIQEKTMC